MVSRESVYKNLILILLVIEATSLNLRGEIETNERRIAIGLPILSFSREKTFESQSYTVPIGVSADFYQFISESKLCKIII